MPRKPKGNTDQPGPKQLSLSPVVSRLLDAAVDIRENPDAADIAYMARQLVQCTLPHSDPGDVPLWSRTNGSLTLTLEPHVDRKTLKHLYPYGSIPRLLLFWLVTEATRTRNRQVRLGNSLDAFMREIGLNPRTGGGKRGDAKRLQVQMERLFRATISFEDTRPAHKAWVDMQVAPKAVLWWDTSRSLQDNLWDSWVELGEDFYKAITAAPVPVDYRALKALKRSPLALDLYAWATHTAFSARQRRQPRIVPWEALHAQMGAEYADLFAFRYKVIAALRKIQLVYPDLKFEVSTERGVTIFPSFSAIAPKA